jgi:hypothetical protein
MSFTESLESISIKVPGKWNTKLFHPDWIIKNLFEDKTQIYVLFNFEEREIGFKLDDISIFPKEENLEIQIEKNEDNSFKRDSMIYGTEIILKVLKLLPHTPIRSLDFDYSFILENNNKFSNFITTNNNALVSGFSMNKYKIDKKEIDYKLSIVVSEHEGTKFKVNFIYQYEEFKALKNEVITENLDQSIKVLNEK